MSADEIRRLAELMDRWLYAFDVDSEEAHQAHQARRQFDALLGWLYDKDVPNGVPPFSEYRFEAVKLCRAWLRKNT